MVFNVSQHAKIAKEMLGSILKSFQFVNERIRHLAGELWSDIIESAIKQFYFS